MKKVYDCLVEEAGISEGPFESVPLPAQTLCSTSLLLLLTCSPLLWVLELNVDKSYLLERSQIVESVVAGEIRQAVSRLSDVDSTLLRGIGFHLQKQALLEIIKKGNVPSEALKYAQVQVAPLAKDRPEFVAELENVMSLLLYSNVVLSPDRDLLSDEQRQKTAEIANSALLRYAQLSERPKLDRIMKCIFWAQTTAQRYGILTPKLLDLRSLVFEARGMEKRTENDDGEDDESIILRMDVTGEDDPEEEEGEAMDVEGDDEDDEEGELEGDEEEDDEDPALAVFPYLVSEEGHVGAEEEED